MDTSQIEFCANKFLEFCKKNPTLCPHSYRFVWSQKIEEDIDEIHLECSICNTEITKYRVHYKRLMWREYLEDTYTDFDELSYAKEFLESKKKENEQ